MLTTITPYWGRPKVLKAWLRALEGSFHRDVHHIVLVAGNHIQETTQNPNVRIVGCQVGCRLPSIGYFHNLGARLAGTEWIMKLDLDAFPHADFFRELLPILQKAPARAWFNCGMFYVSRGSSEAYLDALQMPLRVATYGQIVKDIRQHSAYTYHFPAATNFICRRDDYNNLGGSDPGFQGWGWEDYQQIYMLEKYQRQADPLPGPITWHNVTQRCRDEISRPKALELYNRSCWLALLHCWHPANTDPHYRSKVIANHNRQILLNYIERSRQ